MANFTDRAMMEVIGMAIDNVELMTDATLAQVKDFVLSFEGDEHQFFKACKDEQFKRANHYYD
jgi:hypothetical protein